MRAKKSFGQHFLTNEAIASRIAGSLLKLENGNWEIGEKPRVLEIGPGKGMLTKYLLEKNIDLKVVEADTDMVAYLEDNYPELDGRIIGGDFLKLDLSKVFANPSDLRPQTSQFLLIGNFPYNISSQIVFKMVEYRRLIPEMAGMFQKEMAQRIIAPPGGKDYGVISVLTQAFYEGKYLFSVGNKNFNPPPKVQSGVIRLTRREGELGCDEELFRKVVKQAFSQRRKMLRNTLKPFFDDPAVLEEDFFKKRPEVLSVAEFVELTKRIAGQ
jgi:16S rRNA (adenine1518-N6/adenine1519-N6)-dimethyltransferase